MPNYRQQKRYARESLPIARSTQCDWIVSTAQTLEILYEIIGREILQSEVIQTDETQIKIQDRKLKKKMRKAKMFVCRGDRNHKLVYFGYSKDLSFTENKKFFAGFTGIIQADAATGFDALFDEAVEAGCHAHARRKVFDARDLDTERVDLMLDIYDELYKIERKAKHLNPEQRRAYRRRFSKELVKQLRIHHVINKNSLAPSHLLAEAASYSLNHWVALTRFLKNPHIELDINASEREIKAFVISRKNFLHSGSDSGAKALAVHFTLVASAKRNGLNPVEYLTDVLSRINDMKTSDLHLLLPDRWKPDRS